MDFLKKIFRRKKGYEQIEKNSAKDFSRVVYTVGLYIVFRQFSPLDAFYVSYFTSPPFNFTTEELNKEILPLGTFAACAFLVATLLVTDYLRYKPVLILDTVLAVTSYAVLLGKPTKLALSMSQVLGGTTFVSNLVPSAYLYAKINDVNQYQKMTSLVRGFFLFGLFISSAFSQILVSFDWLPKTSLLYFSIGGLALSCVFSFFIPPVENSVYFHCRQEVHAGNEEIPAVIPQKLSVVVERIASDLKTSYTNTYVLKWSIWWIFGFSALIYVDSYAQVLWQEMSTQGDGDVNLMNGTVNCLAFLSGSIVTYCVGFLNWDWKSHAELILSMSSLTSAILIQYMYWSSSLFWVYVTYIVFCCTFQVALVIAKSEVAKELENDCFALIFGCNHLFTFVINTILTFLIIKGWVISLSIREQFLFYALLFGLMGFVYFVRFLWIQSIKFLPTNR